MLDWRKKLDCAVICITSHKCVTLRLRSLTPLLPAGRMVRYLSWIVKCNFFIYSIFCLHDQSYFFSDCPIPLPSNVPVIDGEIICNLGASCSEVVCCLHAKPLFRHVSIHLKLNFCQDMITIGIDKFTRKIQPSVYNNWGKICFRI